MNPSRINLPKFLAFVAPSNQAGSLFSVSFACAHVPFRVRIKNRGEMMSERIAFAVVAVASCT